jgi:hypothetical protein
MARQSIRKGSSARTRKALCGGIPMFLRKFTQRVGNSAPWGLIQKFKKAYKDGVRTSGENPITYKYFILSLREGMAIQGKVNNLGIQKESSKELDNYISRFDKKIQALFNDCKLAVVVNNANEKTTDSNYIILHCGNRNTGEVKMTPIRDFHEFSTDKTINKSVYNSIRIFLYRPQLTMPTNKVQIPSEYQRNANGILPHELAALSKSAPPRARPVRPEPATYKNNTGQIPAFHKPNNYNIANNASLEKFMNYLINHIGNRPNNNIEYLDRNADNTNKYLLPIDFEIALSSLKQLPTYTMAVYTIRKSITTNQSGIPSLIYLSNSANNNNKLVFKVLDCERRFIIENNKLKPNVIVANLPDSVKYIFGISAVSKLTSKQPNPNPNPNTKYADPQNAIR